MMRFLFPLIPVQSGIHGSPLSRGRATFVTLALGLAMPALAQTGQDAPDSLIGGALIFADSAAETDAFDAGWKGEKVCDLLVDNDVVRAARCMFPPGVGHERHRHAPHWGYVVEGSTMRITDATGVNERIVKDGDSWWSDGVGWHEVVNIGEATGVYIIVEPKATAK